MLDITLQFFGGRGSGGGKRSGGGGGSAAGSSSSIKTQVAPSAEQKAESKATINSFNSSTRYQTKTVIDGNTGDTMEISLEKVTTRDYWGKSTGEKTYTLNIVNTSEGRDRVFYDYGVKELRRVKDFMRRYTHNA